MRTVTLIRADIHIVMKAAVLPIIKTQVGISFAFFGVALVVAYIVG